jgi:hypothetical protein
MALGLDAGRPDIVGVRDAEAKYLIRHWVCPEGEAPGLIPARGAVFPGDTLPKGYAVESAYVQPREHGTVWVVCTYLKPILLSETALSGNLYELVRRHRRRSVRSPSGVRVAIGLQTTIDADVTAALPLGGHFPGGGTGMWDAYLTEVDIQDDFRPGLARVVAHYEAPTRNGALERNPGKGILEVDITTYSQHLKYDLAGTPLLIDGEFEDGGVRYRWRVIKGSDLVYLGACSLRLSVALSAANTATLIGVLKGLMGKCNNAACSALGGQYTLLMRGARLRQRYYNESLFLAQIYMDYNPDGWTTNCTVEKQKCKVVEQPVFDAAGNDTGRKHLVEMWGDLTPRVTATRTVALTGDFSTLNGYLV